VFRLSLLPPGQLPASAAAGVVTAPPWRRGPGPRPATYFKYNLRSCVRSPSLSSPAGDNLVSQGSRSSAATTMSDESAANAATGLRVDDRELTMAEVTARIKAIEDMMHPLIPLVDQVAALTIAIA
jgi:hypothetical protein